jgi:hypothetical protein
LRIAVVLGSHAGGPDLIELVEEASVSGGHRGVAAPRLRIEVADRGVVARYPRIPAAVPRKMCVCSVFIEGASLALHFDVDLLAQRIRLLCTHVLSVRNARLDVTGKVPLNSK